MVRYLRDRFRNHKTAALPNNLQVTAYAPLGKERPRLIVSYQESAQVREGNGIFVVSLELRYEPDEYLRGDDSKVTDHNELPEEVEALHDLMFQFLADSRIAEAGIAIIKEGTMSSSAELDEATSLAIVITQEFQAVVIGDEA